MKWGRDPDEDEMVVCAHTNCSLSQTAILPSSGTVKTVRQYLFYMEDNKTINTSTSVFCP